VIILIAEICAGVLLYFQKGALETLIGKTSYNSTSFVDQDLQRLQFARSTGYLLIEEEKTLTKQ
jgi:hypothetical protein